MLDANTHAAGKQNLRSMMLDLKHGYEYGTVEKAISTRGARKGCVSGVFIHEQLLVTIGECYGSSK